jgi:purine-nucleoside phosphorylase
MVWGHRNDVDGFAAGLAAVDAALPEILSALRPGDGLIITADHGVDPTTPSTDHSREYVPLLLYPPPETSPAAVYEGTLADTGATIFTALSGAVPGLGGDVITSLHPSRGWRRYTPAQSCPESGQGSSPTRRAERRVPGRVGPADAIEAAAYLRAHLGPPPTAAIVLGSGLAGALRQALSLEALSVEVPYGDIPSWRAGTVAGHPYRLTIGQWGSRPVVLLEGRVHGYEGFDLSELQLPVRTMAEWGVGCVLLTSACGAVAAALRPGDVVIASEVLDCQTAGLCRVDTPAAPTAAPSMLAATPADLAVRVVAAAGAPAWLTGGVHACVPGPHYETDAELELLRALGASTVSMSGAPELRAIREVGVTAAVLGVVVNAGHTSHGGVLTGAGEAAASFSAAVAAVLTSWGY